MGPDYWSNDFSARLGPNDVHIFRGSFSDCAVAIFAVIVETGLRSPRLFLPTARPMFYRIVSPLRDFPAPWCGPTAYR